MLSTGERLSGTRRSSALASEIVKAARRSAALGQRRDDRGVLVDRAAHFPTRTGGAGARWRSQGERRAPRGSTPRPARAAASRSAPCGSCARSTSDVPILQTSSAESPSSERDSRQETRLVQPGLHDLRFLPLNHIGFRRPEMAWESPQTAGISFVSPAHLRTYRDAARIPSLETQSSLGQTAVGQRHQQVSMGIEAPSARGGARPHSAQQRPGREPRRHEGYAFNVDVGFGAQRRPGRRPRRH